MRKIFLVLLLNLILTGCIKQNNTQDVVDQIYTTKVKNESLIVFNCQDNYVTLTDTNIYWVRLYDSNPSFTLQDGEFAEITADVTYYSGGVAGFQNNPEINKIKNIQIISLDEAKDICNIQELPESIDGFWKPYIWNYNDIEYLIFNLFGDTYIYQDSTYIDTIENLYQEENLTEVLSKSIK